LGERLSFQQIMMGKLKINRQKNNLDLSYSMYKCQIKMRHLTIELKLIKLLGKEVEESLHNIIFAFTS
jgi:hypothetical protein